MKNSEKKTSLLKSLPEIIPVLAKKVFAGLSAFISFISQLGKRAVTDYTNARPKNIDRRSALQKGAGGIIALATMGMPFALARLLAPAKESLIDPQTADKNKRNILHRQQRNVRPLPGALASHAEFVQACIGCGLCGEICPPACIKFYKREGGKDINIPYIDTSERGCILCGKCMDVCPTNALTVTPRKEIDMGIAQIDRAACFPWVDKGICGACVGICPIGKEAISFKSWNQYQPRVHSACVGCGMCVEICPHPSTPIWIMNRTTDSMRATKI